MKTYKHLMEELLSEENIVTAIKKLESEKHKKKVKKLKRRLKSNPEETVDEIRDIVLNYEQNAHTVVKIVVGVSNKNREIIIPKFNDLIVQNCLMGVLRPIIMKSMYEKVYGSLPGRGIHAGKAAIEKWIRNDPANCKYFAKMDIKKFFPSIPLDRLHALVSKYIRDKQFVDLLFKATTSEGVDGVPLGFYPSPWLANYYLQKMDHYIKEELAVPHYIRYMDDMVIFGPNKKKLKAAVEAIIEYASEKIGLTIKPNYQLERFSYKATAKNDAEKIDLRKRNDEGTPLDFMGFKFYRTRTILRKNLMLKITRKARRLGSKKEITCHDARSIISYMGWIKCTDTYDLYLRRIKPYVNIGACKAKCSRHDKRYIQNEKMVIINEHDFLSVGIDQVAA